MPQTRKAYLVKVGDITLGVVTNKYPTKQEVKLQLELALTHELKQVRLGTSGWRKFENIRKDEEEVRDIFIHAYGLANKNQYNVKFLQEVQL